MTAAHLRVVVLDDDPRVAAGLRRLLEATPGVTVVPLGAVADVALVDVGLPDRVAAVSRVRGLAGGVPVVALSLDGTARQAVLAAGARAFVEKDGAPDDLLAALARRGDLIPCPRQSPEELPVTITRPGTAPTAAAATARRGGIIVLLVAAFLGPWLVWGSTIAQSRGLLGWRLPQGLALWTITPALLLAVLAVGGRPALRDLAGRMVHVRGTARWCLLALAIPVALAAGAAALVAFGGGQVRLGATLGLPAALAYLVYGTGLFLLTEEAAWRGALLPRLQARVSPLTANLVLGAIWALWHVPLLVAPGAGDEGLPILPFAVCVVGTSVLIGTLVNAAHGSVVVAAVFHAAFDAAYSYAGVVGPDHAVLWTTAALTTVVAATVAVRTRGRLGLDGSAGRGRLLTGRTRGPAANS